ncbi:MAG: HYR domain-containing protein, partial [Bacteroidota bacterium]
ATATGLVAGQYSVTVSDSLGCEIVLTTVIGEPALLIVGELFHQDVNCADEPTGFSHAFVSGGVQPYTFFWTSGDTTNTADSLVAGGYTLFVTDANGCVQTIFTEIEALDSMPPVLIVQNAFVILDANGQATVTAAQFDAGTTDNCSLASFTVSQTTFGCADIGFNTVTITAIDVNGNTATATATVNVLDATAPVLTCPSNITVGACNSTVSFGAIGFSDNCPLDSSQLMQTAGLASGSTFPVGVTLQVFSYTDAAGNQGTCFFTVTVSDSVSASVAATTNVLCASDCNGSASLLVSGGQLPYTVLWSNGASDTFVDSLCAGTYTATVTDANGCSSTVEVTITEPAPVALSLTNVVNPPCPDDANGTITAEASGGTQPYTFLWSNGSTSATIGNLGVGVYAVVVSDANGCTAATTVNLTAADTTAPVLVVQNDTVSLDANGEVSLTASQFVTSASDNCGNFGLDIQPVNFGCADLGTHTVAITATDENGNVSTAAAIVTIVDNVAPALDCPDDIVAGDCNPNVLFVLPQISDNCDVNPLLLVQTSGLVSGSLFPVGVTVQAFSYTDAAGNIGTCSFTVTVSVPADITATIADPTCADVCDATATLTIAGGVPPFVVLWSNGDAGLTADSLCGGIFTATVTDASLCLQIFTGTITAPSALDFNIDQVTNEVNGAGNGSISITVTGGIAPYTFAWTKDGAAFSTNEDLVNLEAGTYIFTATDANGCVIASEEIVVENETGTGEPAWATGIALQPNPAMDWVRLELKQPLTQGMEVRFLDATGKLARIFRLESQQATAVFDLSGMAAGLYSVQMLSAESAVVRRLVIGR